MFALNIAWRFLKSGKGQTILILAGIAIGISVQVFIGLLIQGLQNTLLDSTIGSTPHITVEALENNGEIFRWEEKAFEIEDRIEDIKFLAPTLTLPAFLTIEDTSEAILFRGFDLDRGKDIYKYDQNLVEGRLPTQKGEVLLGVGLQDQLGISIDDELQVSGFEGERSEVNVVGFVDFRVISLNESLVISNLNTAQDFFNREGSITAIEIQVNQVFDADSRADEIEELLGSSYGVSNWKEANADLLSGLQGQDISSIMIQVFVVIAVVLGISSVLAISVIQRSKQIGILKAMGVNDQGAQNIFLFQGLILGIAGGVLGVALGLIITYSFTIFATNADGSPVVDITLNYGFVALSFVIAVIASTFAALIPARKSSKLEPIEVIRNG